MFDQRLSASGFARQASAMARAGSPRGRPPRRIATRVVQAGIDFDQGFGAVGAALQAARMASSAFADPPVGRDDVDDVYVSASPRNEWTSFNAFLRIAGLASPMSLANTSA